MKPLYSIATAFLLTMLGACTTPGALQPENVPVLFSSDVSAEATEPTCDAMQAEADELDTKLELPAVETPPPEPPTSGERWWAYGKNLVVQTVIGPLQPIIQTVRAIANTDSIEERSEIGQERGATRRAYLMGRMDASQCDLPPTEAVSQQ